MSLSVFEMQHKGIGYIPVYGQPDEHDISTITIGDLTLEVANLSYGEDYISFEELPGTNAADKLSRRLVYLIPHNSFDCLVYFPDYCFGIFYTCCLPDGRFYEEYYPIEWEYNDKGERVPYDDPD